MKKTKPRSHSRIMLALLAVTLLGGCQAGTGGPSAPATPAPVSTSTTAEGEAKPAEAGGTELPGEAAVTVRVQVIGQSDVTLEQEFTAQVLAANEVEIRSRIDGYLQDFYFREGSQVRAGQVLFTVDPRPLLAQEDMARAKVEEARAQLKFTQERVNWKKARADLAQAEANLANQQREVDRYKPLMESGTIPRQLYEQTVSARDVAAAKLDAAKAEVENTAIRDNASIANAQAGLHAALANLEGARVNLDYTTITAPISGTIGELNVYPGTLVSPGSAVLATISATDPIYVEFAISQGDYLLLTRSDRTEQQKQERKFEMILADGQPYESLGKFVMVDRTIDQQTGTLKVRLEYPNPRGVLKPGQYVKVRLNRSDVPNALLVPQRAVLELQSSNYVWIVKEDNTVEQREISLGERYHDSFVVKEGLKAGDRVVVDGMARLKPGMTVSAKASE